MNTEKSEIFGVQKWQWGIVALALLGLVTFLYFYGSGTPYSGTETGDGDVGRLIEQGNSDDISAIELDLGSTDLTDLDRELTDIDAQLR